MLRTLFALVGIGFFIGSGHLFGQIVVATRPRPPQTMMRHQACPPPEIWIDGHWQWNTVRQRYEWIEGKCERCPRGRVYQPGRWKRVDEGWIWVPGRWEKVADNRSG